MGLEWTETNNRVSPSPQIQSPLVAHMVKNPLAMQETRVLSLGLEDPLEKGMATHSSILAWRVPLTESGKGDSPRGRRVGDDWMTKHAHSKCIICLVSPRNSWVTGGRGHVPACAGHCISWRAPRLKGWKVCGSQSPNGWISPRSQELWTMKGTWETHCKETLHHLETTYWSRILGSWFLNSGCSEHFNKFFFYSEDRDPRFLKAGFRGRVAHRFLSEEQRGEAGLPLDQILGVESKPQNFTLSFC